MMCGISGTPGTGKSSVAQELAQRGHRVIHAVDTVQPYIISWDEERETSVIDEDRWATAFQRFDGFVEGSIAHYLLCDFIVVLRCRPDILAKRLAVRNYPPQKIHENAEAEALDTILIEVVETYQREQIHEIDTTSLTIQQTADEIEMVTTGTIPSSFGGVDWSAYLRGVG